MNETNCKDTQFFETARKKSEAVFVEVLEEGIGAVVFANRQPVETHEVGILHIG